MKKLLEKISAVTTTLAIFSGLLLALGKAFQVFDQEFKKSMPADVPLVPAEKIVNETNNIV